MTRQVLIVADDGHLELCTQIRTISWRATRCDAQGYPLADAPGPHAAEQSRLALPPSNYIPRRFLEAPCHE